MNSITHSQRYLPHTFNTRFYAVNLYRSGCSVNFVCRRYHISKASLMRWNKRFDGTKDSLMDKSHRPITPHPNAHTHIELKWIKDLHRRNPNISVCEMYGKLRSQKGYSRHPGSLYRIYKALGFSSKAPSTKKKRKPQKYHTPSSLGIKWQMDVKYVPSACYVGQMPDKFYQYTVIDEASRESSCIEHKLIRPRTPWHNGKVERSHRNDQERFYNFLTFYSFDDLKAQMYRYMRRSNRIPMAVLGWMSPIEKRFQLEAMASGSCSM